MFTSFPGHGRHGFKLKLAMQSSIGKSESDFFWTHTVNAVCAIFVYSSAYSFHNFLLRILCTRNFVRF